MLRSFLAALRDGIAPCGCGLRRARIACCELIVGYFGGSHVRSVFESERPAKKDAVDQLILDAHSKCIRNREALQRVGRCGCFYCLAIFDPEEIGEWIEDEGGDTALCPRCEIDSVLPESGEYPLTKDFLRRMYDYWF